jgi:hypothetical protein
MIFPVLTKLCKLRTIANEKDNDPYPSNVSKIDIKLKVDIFQSVYSLSTNGISKLTMTIVIAVAIIVVASGSILAYTVFTQTTTNTSSIVTSSLQSTTISSESSSQTNVASTQNASWDRYLGYIPQGYVVSAKYPNSPFFPCPTGMSSAQCTLFQQTCGNGVCDPNETCQTCPLDCPVNGVMVCDPYTGRAGAPASVCQLAAQTPPPSP